MSAESVSSGLSRMEEPPEPARLVAGSTDPSTDPVELLDEVPLSSAEAGYVEAARPANTLRGYRSDWREFTA